MRRLAILALSVVLAHSASAATLIHSNDVMGDLEPCGCRTNPLGGMARKYNLLKRLPSSEGPDSRLIVDAGDLLFSSSVVPELLRAQAELQASYLLKSLELAHQDVIVPGEKDFALGVKTFDRLRAKSKIKFLAANLVRKSGAGYLKPSAVFQLKSPPLKVAVIGIVGAGAGYPSELKVTAPIAAARREVAKWRKLADLVVVVTHQGAEEDQKLAAAVPGIDILVGAHTQSFYQEPPRVK